MVYAQILNGIVENTIVVDEETPLELFEIGYEALVRIDELEPRPNIGWCYINGQLEEPPNVY